jgi:hypothetical protein
MNLKALASAFLTFAITFCLVVILPTPDAKAQVTCSSPGIGMTTTIRLIRDARTSNGYTLPSSQWSTAGAIAKAESCLNPNATHTNKDGSKDRGLWQLNNQIYPLIGDSCAYDRVCGTRQMVIIYRDGGWSRWSAYNNQSYKQFLSEASNAVSTVQCESGGAC